MLGGAAGGAPACLLFVTELEHPAVPCVSAVSIIALRAAAQPPPRRALALNLGFLYMVVERAPVTPHTVQEV